MVFIQRKHSLKGAYQRLQLLPEYFVRKMTFPKVVIMLTDFACPLGAAEDIPDCFDMLRGQVALLGHYRLKPQRAYIRPVNRFIIVHEDGFLCQHAFNKSVAESLVRAEISACCRIGVCIRK